MIQFAFVDTDGIPTGGGIRPALPNGAIALTKPFTTADLPRLRWTAEGWTLREIGPAPQPTAEELAQRAEMLLTRAKTLAVARVNQLVGAFRARIYTDIAGQDALYLEKRTEAVAYIREAEMSGEPKGLEDYPLLAGEVGITAPTAWQLAQIWLHVSDQFKAVGAATERLRMLAATAIADAPDDTAIEKAETAFVDALSRLTS